MVEAPQIGQGVGEIHWMVWSCGHAGFSGLLLNQKTIKIVFQKHYALCETRFARCFRKAFSWDIYLVAILGGEASTCRNYQL